MCGIVGYIGAQEATPILLKGLSRLEYRGYDSAGVAVIGEDGIHVSKAQGRLDVLRSQLEREPLHGSAGIGHTRWATHGEPSQVNSHPHTDVKGEIAVVHNGIIENYAELKAFLIREGCVFVSQTDTEVVAHLINYYYKGDLRRAIEQAAHRLEGSYALGIVCAKEPDALYCIRKDSPLVVGVGKGENFIASDIPALLPYTREMVLLEEREIARLTRDGITIYDELGGTKAFTSYHVTWDAEAAEKGGYPHFMLKEIDEEPKSLLNTLTAHVDMSVPAVRPDGFPDAAQVKRLKRLIVVACGTAYHAGVAGSHMLEALTDMDVQVEVASEFRYHGLKLREGDMMVVVSQSGETADTLSALREGKRQGIPVLAITNVVGSSIAREADSVLYTYAGPEIAVASTKAYITQLLVFALLALDAGHKRGTVDDVRYTQGLLALNELPGKAQTLTARKEDVQRFAARHFDVPHVFYIGRGMDYALAMEGSLKLKEISYIFSEAYAAGELKHGTIALIEPGTLVTALCMQKRLIEKMRSNIKEVRSRGASVLCIQPEDVEMPDDDLCDTLWRIPETWDIFSPILGVIPLQLLAYYMAVSKGCDVDKPRNLAKSVTVE